VFGAELCSDVTRVVDIASFEVAPVVLSGDDNVLAGRVDIRRVVVWFDVPSAMVRSEFEVRAEVEFGVIDHDTVVAVVTNDVVVAHGAVIT